MTAKPSAPGGPITAFTLSVVAFAVAFAAAFFGRPSSGLPTPALAVGYALPVVLGLAAAWLGGRTLHGGGFGFFAILIGLLSAVTGACVTYARLIAGSPF
jgi:hypothetical protein